MSSTPTCPRCLGPLGEGRLSRRYIDMHAVLICAPCRREQEWNAHRWRGGRPDDKIMVHPNREVWPIPEEQRFLPR